jgi:transcriptional regulator with XRE-family HTH domain
MESESWFKEKLEAFKDDFDFRLETLIYNITEEISIRLEEKKIKRKKFADLLNVSPPAVTKILNGTSNFTLKTLLSLADALDFNLKVEFEDKPAEDFHYVSTGKIVFELASDDKVEIEPQDDDKASHSKAHSTAYSENFDLAA